MDIDYKNITMTIGGIKLVGVINKKIQLGDFDELFKPPSSPSWKGIKISKKGSFKMFANYKTIWYLKNYMFIKNRAPRGMRIKEKNNGC